MSKFLGQKTFIRKIKGIPSIFEKMIVSIFWGVLASIFLCYLFFPDSFYDSVETSFDFLKSDFQRTNLLRDRTIGNFTLEVIEETKNLYNSYLEGIHYFVIGFSLLFFTLMSFFKKSKDESEIHLRGSVIKKGEDFNGDVRKLLQEEVKEIQKDTGKSKMNLKFSHDLKKNMIGNSFKCDYSGAKLPEFLMFRHLMATGVTGTGKSTLIKHYMEHCRKYGEKCIVLDLNGEFYSELGTQDDVILSLYDKRSAKWDFREEQSGGVKVHNSKLAEFLIPEGDQQNSFWWQAGRGVLKSLLDNDLAYDGLR